MAMSDDENIRQHSAPELFPPPFPTREKYATAGTIYFGWGPHERGTEDIRFVVSKSRSTGASLVVSSWPLTRDGWRARGTYGVRTSRPRRGRRQGVARR